MKRKILSPFTMLGSPRSTLIIFVVAVSSLSGCTGPDDPVTLEVRYSGTAAYPLALARFSGGARGQLIADGSTLSVAGPPFLLPVTVVRPSSAWPFNVSLVGVGHDTLAAVAGVLRLDPGYAVRLGVLVLPNLTGAFICAPILARIPVRGPAPVQDTLYLLSDAVPTGQFGPVC